jgi:DNA (cytosine-5)-methyltransferase 1
MPTAISLFSGAGGDSLGLTQAGVNVIAFSEINKICCESHRTNFEHCELISENNTSDITRISDATLSNYKGKVNIIFAGFPCQGFSTAGKKKDDDPRNSLFMEFVRATKLIQPDMIIGENVKGLLKKKLQTGVSYIDIIVAEFTKLGYKVQYKVCKCDDYGIPQKRERLIIVGIKENSFQWSLQFPPVSTLKPHLKDIVHYNMKGAVLVPETLFEGIPLNCILTNMEDINVYPDNNSAHPYLVRKLQPTEAQRTYRINKELKVFDNLFSFGKRDSPIHCEIIDIRKPSKTIICTYNHQPRLFVPLKNSSGCFLRSLLPEELKQIQGFPKDYIICGNVKEQVIQIGNAVPPPLIRQIVETIIKN